MALLGDFSGGRRLALPAWATLLRTWCSIYWKHARTVGGLIKTVVVGEEVSLSDRKGLSKKCNTADPHMMPPATRSKDRNESISSSARKKCSNLDLLNMIEQYRNS